MSHAQKVLRAELSASQQNTIQVINLDLSCRGNAVRAAFITSGCKGYSNYVNVCIDIMNLSDTARKGTHEIYLYDLKLILAKFRNLIDLIENNTDTTLQALTNCLIKCHCSIDSMICDIISPYQSVQE